MSDIKMKEGSSETTRETTFNFDNFNKLFLEYKLSRSLPPQKFLEWFVGFSEGDGSFIFSKNRCFFIINQKDIKTLYLIKEKLGFGNVSFYKGYGRFIVADKKFINLLALLFNGNLVLNKTNTRIKSWFFSKQESDILFESNHISSNKKINFLDNYWFSGFVGAEGCFNTLITKRGQGLRYRPRFFVDQKDEHQVLFDIKNCLGFGYVYNRPNTTHYRYVVDSFSNSSKVIGYFDKFKSYHIQKNIDYLKWRAFVIKYSSVKINKIV